MTLPLLLAAVAAVLAVLSAVLYRRFGVRGRVVASDARVARPARVMRSARHGVSGKPDYLVEERGRVVPVELKPARRAEKPWLRDVVQLAAYCLLLEEIEPRFAGYGYLRYADRTFRIDFTDTLREELLRTLAALRADLAAADVEPNHADPRRCARCALIAACGRPIGARPEARA
ncbi:MAG TPA: Dna2/Cas4 domain-containing protein [Gemmatimonadaceae bacterium]